MPVACTLVPWRTIGRSRGTWEHKKRDPGIQARVLIDFAAAVFHNVESWLAIGVKHRCFVPACFQADFPGMFCFYLDIGGFKIEDRM